MFYLQHIERAVHLLRADDFGQDLVTDLVPKNKPKMGLVRAF